MISLALLPFEALRDFQFLARVSERGNGRLDLFDVAKIDTALGKFADDDLAKTAQTRGVFRGQSDFIFLGQDFDHDAFEIEARGQFFARLIDGVVDLLFVDFRNDVERRHERILRQSNSTSKPLLAIRLRYFDAAVPCLQPYLSFRCRTNQHVDLADGITTTFFLLGEVIGNFPIIGFGDEVKRRIDRNKSAHPAVDRFRVD